jgi:hypothetical protein
MHRKAILVTLVLSALLPSIVVAQECDPKTVENEIAERYSPSRIQATNGMCETANLQIEMIEYAKTSYRACLRGKSLADVIKELDRALGLAKQQKADVGCS